MHFIQCIKGILKYLDNKNANDYILFALKKDKC